MQDWFVRLLFIHVIYPRLRTVFSGLVVINIIQGHNPSGGESQQPVKYHYWRIFALHKAIICEVNI